MGCEERAERERASQVIILHLHTLIIWGSAQVPTLCSTINSLGRVAESKEEGQGGIEGNRQSEIVGGHLYSALII